jgi:1-acyl-sn-glycerol-3-phosphate acyltransferase
MRTVFSVLYWLMFAFTCVLNYGIALIIWLCTAAFDPARRANHQFSCAWGYAYVRLFPGWTTRVTGRHHIEHGKAYVLVANHASMADIVLAFGLFRQFKWLSKASVFRLPFLGWNMKLCRYVPLARGDKESIAKAMTECGSWLKRGISILMFPEGTRTRDGELRPFKHGAFTLALENGVPVVPMAVHGTFDLVPKDRAQLAPQANLHLEVLPPVSPEGFEDAEQFAAAIKEILRERLDARKAAVAQPAGQIPSAAAG